MSMGSGANRYEGLSHFSQILSDGRNRDNTLLPELNALFMLYTQLEKRVEQITTENHQLRKQMIDIVRSLDLSSRIDGMTRLANRRGILEKIEQEVTRARRHSCPITILLADIDNFERVNTTHGYNSGDDVLVELACLLGGIVRNEDICARWGGDRFLILLPETDLEGALPVASKVVEAVSMTEFKVGNPGIAITVSIGVSVYDSTALSTQDFLAKAHQALRQAKQEGNNRYCVAAGQSPES